MRFDPCFLTRAAATTGMLVLSWVPATEVSANACVHPEGADRPKIGLVLGGGGARGGAHVGVLKFLEEQRIPVDLVTGTSMGAIIGGLYAAGMSAGEIEAVLLDTPWAELFDDDTTRSRRTLRRKTDDELNLHGPRLGVGENSSLLPGGAVAGQKIGLLFEELVSTRTRASDFDELPIPFRAVSADLVTGNMVLLDSGQLSLAMRSSMSVPGAFDPVRQGEALLVDGGIVNNVPVDVARSMGADIVIAVDVSTPEMSADKLDNLLSVVNQLTTLMVSSNTEKQIASLRDKDILLRPELSDEFTSAAFGEIEHIVPVGYQAAVDSTDALSVLSVPDDEYTAWRQSVTRCSTPTPTLQFVRLKNNSRFSDEVIFNKLTVKPGDTLDHAQLQNDIAHIYGLGFIRHAQYRVVEEDGRSGLVIEVQQDTRGTDFIETGLGLSGDGRGSFLDLRAAYLRTDLTERGAEFRAAVQVGSTLGLETGAYIPLDDHLRWIIRPQLFLSRRELLAFDGAGHPLAQLDIEEGGGKFSFGRELGRHAGIFAGVSRYTGKVSVNVGDPAIGSYRFDGSDFTLYGIYDRLDDLYMPSSGSRVTLEYVRSLESLGADQDFEQVRSSFFTAHSWDEHTLWIASRFNTTLDDNAPLYALYTGGGFLNMSGYETNELIGQHFGFSLLGYRYRLGEGGLLPAYVGGTVEYGGAAYRSRDVYGDGSLTGSFYLGYNSPIGPLYLGYGWNRDQSGVIFLRLGSILGGTSIGQR